MNFKKRIVSLFLLVLLLLSTIAFAAIPNPGHKASEIGGNTDADRTFNGTLSENYTFPTNLVVDGKVGLGTANPTSPLQVHTGGTATNIVKVTTSTSGAGIYDGFGAGMSGTNAYVLNYETGNLRFGTSGNDDHMLIDSTGNVGIGTITPDRKLEIVDNSVNAAVQIQNTHASGWSGIEYLDTAGNADLFVGLDSTGRGRYNNMAGQGHQFLVSGTASMTINSAGNVGIGTSNPNFKFKVVQNGDHAIILGSDDGLTYYTSLSSVSGSSTAFLTAGSGSTNSNDLAFRAANAGAETEYMRIKGATGNVGIGTTGPAAKLHVAASDGDGIIIGNPNDQMGLDGGNYSIKFYGYRDVTTNVIGAKITAERTNACCGWLSQGTDLAFYTIAGHGLANADQTLERMRIKDNGNVGIGVVYPLNKLSVGTATNADGLSIENTNNAATTAKSADLIFRGTDTVGTKKDSARIKAYPIANNYVNSGLAFYTRTSDSNTEKMRITHLGNVGIGTASPTSRLHVVGRGDHVGNVGYSTLVLEDLSGFPGVNFRTGNNNWLMRKNGGDNNLEYFYSSDASAPGTGTYSNIMKVTPSAGLALGGSTFANPSVWHGTAVFGKDGTNKVVAGYLAGTINSAIIGGHNSALDAWSDLQLGGTNLHFRTGTGAITRMSIDSIGRVGIGELNPEAKLHITSDSTVRGILVETTSTNTNDFAELQLRADHEFRVGVGGTLAGAELNDRFYVYDVSSNVHRLIIDTTGNVGIGTASPSSKLEVAGDIKVSGYVYDGNGAVTSQNLLSSSSWNIGSGTIGKFGGNGPAAENERLWGTGPHDNRAILWMAKPDAESGADGGWNADVPIDHTKAYRYTIWIKKTGSVNGHTYFGAHASTTNNLDGSSNANPYFWNGDLPELNKWYLLVGYIHGSGDTVTTSQGGIYDGVTGKKVVSMTDFKNKVGATTQRHRAYLYYDTTTTDRQYFYGPRVEEINGNEPSVEALLGHDNSVTKTRTKYVPFGPTTTYNIASTPSLDIGTSGSYRGYIKLHGTTAGAYSVLQTTTNNLHLDSSSTGHTYINHYTPGNIILGQAASTTSVVGMLTAQNGVTVQNSDWNDNVLRVTGGSPSIKFDDTSAGAYAQVGVNDGTFYVLADRDRNSVFDGTYPLSLSLNDATTFQVHGSTIWHAGNDGAGSTLDADLIDGLSSASFLRADTTDYTSGWIGRTAHNVGGLVGSYNNVGANSLNTNPIYTIGTSYLPAVDSLADMYGIGYTHTSAAFLDSGASSWGMYVASDGDARSFIAGGAGGKSYFNAGNVGIGNTNPAYKLDVSGDARINGAIIGSGPIGFYQDASNGAYRANAAGGTRGFYFQTYNGATTRMFLGLEGTYAGRLGIGTATPAQALDVVGNAKVSGQLQLGADTYFYRDTTNRIATPDDFYVQATSGNTYLYSTNTYLGNANGDTIHTRGNVVNLGSSTEPTNTNIYTDADERVNFYFGGTKMGDIGANDASWLRLNQNTATNIYTPRMIRADAGFQMHGAAGVSLLSFADNNKYVWTPAAGWGVHWNTAENDVEYYGASVERAYISLDEGNAGFNVGTFSGGVRAPTAGNNIMYSFGSGTGHAYASSVTGTGDVVFRNLGQLRFGNTADWDWNAWAGIKYDHAGKKMYIGGPASAQFSSNTAPSQIAIAFDGVNRFETTGLSFATDTCPSGDQAVINVDAPSRDLVVKGTLALRAYGAAHNLHFNDQGYRLYVEGSTYLNGEFRAVGSKNSLYAPTMFGSLNDAEATVQVRGNACVYGDNCDVALGYIADGTDAYDMVIEDDLFVNGELFLGDLETAGSSTTMCYKHFNTGIIEPTMCTSLRELKENIETLELGLDEVMKLKPVIYDWINGTKRDVGFIAEEVQEAAPQLSKYDPSGKLIGYQEYGMTALNTKAIQELKVEKDSDIELLREENRLLKQAICDINPSAEVCS